MSGPNERSGFVLVAQAGPEGLVRSSLIVVWTYRTLYIPAPDVVWLGGINGEELGSLRNAPSEEVLRTQESVFEVAPQDAHTRRVYIRRDAVAQVVRRWDVGSPMLAFLNAEGKEIARTPMGLEEFMSTNAIRPDNVPPPLLPDGREGS